MKNNAFTYIQHHFSRKNKSTKKIVIMYSKHENDTDRRTLSRLKKHVDFFICSREANDE